MGVITRLASLFGYEKRVGDPSWDALAPGLGPFAGASARAAENISTILACVDAIATALAYVPALVYRRDGEGNRIEATGHVLGKLVRAGVNEQMTWPDFIEHMLASTLLTGNGLAVVQRAGNGLLAGFSYVPWGMVTVSELASGRLAYDVSDGRGNTRRYLEGEVLHLRDRTDDGKIGRSRLSRSAETVAAARASSTHARSFLENGASPSGSIEIEGRLNDDQTKRLRLSFEHGFTGTNKAGRVLVLDEGKKWKSIQISPEDAELLATRKFDVIELCRLFRVPPPIVQAYENNTFTNAAQAGLWFATFCLAPWARKFEAEFARSVFATGSNYELELDLSGFLRGDPQTRWAAHKIAIDTKVLDPDEVRQIEGWNPRPKNTGV